MRLVLLLLLAILTLGCGPSEAVRELEAAAQGWMQDNPESAQALYDHALEAGGKLDDARATALAAKGDYLLRHEDLDGAKAAYAEGAQLAPQNAAVLAGQGDAALVRGDTEAALDFYESALKVQPKFAPALAGLGMVALTTKDAETAAMWLNEAIAPDAVAFEPGIVIAYARLVELDITRSDAFETWLEGYLQDHPTDLRSHHLAGKYYKARGKTDDAITAWSWVRKQRPDYPRITEDLAELQFQAGHFIEAVKLFEEQYEADPTADRLHLVAISYANLPDFNNALALFDKGIAQFPEDIRFRIGRGQVLYSQGELDAAYDTLHPLTEHGMTSFEVYRELGLIEIKRQHWDEAQRWIDQALQIAPFDEWANFQGAVLAARSGDKAKFEQCMQRVFERGFATEQSLSRFDNYELLMAVDWAAEWVEKRRLVTRGEGR